MKKIAVVGARGQIGRVLCKNLLELGHVVRLIGRSNNIDAVDFFGEELAKNTEVIICDDLENEDEVAKAVEGCDTFVAAIAANEYTVTKVEPVWLNACLKAGVKRFVPSEFGCHTRSLNYGDGCLFNNKKALHEKIFNSNIGWTFIYNGIIFEYCLPNLKFFEEITTFGNLELPIYTHDLNDIGRFAALAITDERTMNKCVQMDFQALTQNEMLELVNKYWSEEPLVYKYYSVAYIKKMKDVTNDKVSAKQGAETDQERWGINNVVYVLGKLHGFTDETLRASELYPDFKFIKAEDAMKKKEFFLEDK